MADVHHFAYGPVNPILAFVLSFLGCLLGLLLAARARESSGASRGRWLVLSAVAIGGTGIWLMHFMAMLGFDIPDSTVRFDPRITALSAAIAVTIVTLGLFVVGFGRSTVLKVIVGGVLTGVGVAAMHYTGMLALRVAGAVTFNPELVGLSVAIAVLASTVALWFAVVIRGGKATVGGALLMAVAVCSMHYTGMAATEVRLGFVDAPVSGVSGVELLVPISIAACIVISALAYATVGFSVQQEDRREEALLDRARDQRAAEAQAEINAQAHARRTAMAGAVTNGAAMGNAPLAGAAAVGARAASGGQHGVLGRPTGPGGTTPPADTVGATELPIRRVPAGHR